MGFDIEAAADFRPRHGQVRFRLFFGRGGGAVEGTRLGEPGAGGIEPVEIRVKVPQQHCNVAPAGKIANVVVNLIRLLQIGAGAGLALRHGCERINPQQHMRVGLGLRRQRPLRPGPAVVIPGFVPMEGILFQVPQCDQHPGAVGGLAIVLVQVQSLGVPFAGVPALAGKMCQFAEAERRDGLALRIAKVPEQGPCFPVRDARGFGLAGVELPLGAVEERHRPPPDFLRRSGLFGRVDGHGYGFARRPRKPGGGGTGYDHPRDQDPSEQRPWHPSGNDASPGQNWRYVNPPSRWQSFDHDLNP